MLFAGQLYMFSRMVQRNAFQASHFLLPQYFVDAKSIQWQAKLSSKEKEKKYLRG
jgi:hypothetical protein